MTYKETNFRSVLEAKYAVIFDELEIPWVYEPCRIGNYIPDFIIHTYEYAEVKAFINPNIKVWETFINNYIIEKNKLFPIIYQLYGKIINHNGIGILGCRWDDGKSEPLKIVEYKNKYLILPITELIKEPYVSYNDLNKMFIDAELNLYKKDGIF